MIRQSWQRLRALGAHYFGASKAMYLDWKKLRVLSGREKTELSPSERLFIHDAKQTMRETLPWAAFFMVPYIGYSTLLVGAYRPHWLPRRFQTPEAQVQTKEKEKKERRQAMAEVLKGVGVVNVHTQLKVLGAGYVVGESWMPLWMAQRRLRRACLGVAARDVDVREYEQVEVHELANALWMRGDFERSERVSEGDDEDVLVEARTRMAHWADEVRTQVDGDAEKVKEEWLVKYMAEWATGVR